MKRRAFLGAASAAAVVLSHPLRSLSAVQGNELVFKSATELAGLIRRGEKAATEVVEAHFERIDEIDSDLNALVKNNPHALDEARFADKALRRGVLLGPLHGVPVTIKDEFKTKGIVSTIGTEGLKDYIPDEDATIVKRLRQAGAIVLGKTNAPELLWSGETDNLVYGRTSNPYDLDCTPGGSSGGEAALIAAGGSPLGVGSDAAGSIRSPAHYCGIAGLKPTWGMVPLTGSLMPVLPELTRFDAAGPMARFVEDLRLALPILSGPDVGDPFSAAPVRQLPRKPVSQMKIAYFLRTEKSEPTAELQEATQAAVKALEQAGAKVEQAALPGIEDAIELLITLLADDLEVGLRKALKDYGTRNVHKHLSGVLDYSRRLMKKLGSNTPERRLERHRRWYAFKEQTERFFTEYDAVVCPPEPDCAFKHNQFHQFLLESDEMPTGVEYQTAFNISGSPAGVVRCSTTAEGLPIGVQVASGMYRDAAVLDVLQVMQDALGGWKPPSI